MPYFDIKWSFKGSLLRLLDRQQPCYLCGAMIGTTHGLCPECEADLPRPGAACPQCAAAMPDETSHYAGPPRIFVLDRLGKKSLCSDCRNEPPAFSNTVAALTYRYPVDILVRDLKYRGQIQLAALLAGQLHQALLKLPNHQQGAVAQKGLNDAAPPEESWRIAFVPQSRTRLKERGYNQAEEIARQLSAKTGLPLLRTGLKRVRETPHQAGLDRTLRQQNLEGAFACKGKVQGLKIAVVDDVMTTGATLNAVASCLRLAGATSVSAWVVARTPAPDFAPMR